MKIVLFTLAGIVILFLLIFSPFFQSLTGIHLPTPSFVPAPPQLNSTSTKPAVTPPPPPKPQEGGNPPGFIGPSGPPSVVGPPAPPPGAQ